MNTYVYWHSCVYVYTYIYIFVHISMSFSALNYTSFGGISSHRQSARGSGPVTCGCLAANPPSYCPPCWRTSWWLGLFQVGQVASGYWIGRYERGDTLSNKNAEHPLDNQDFSDSHQQSWESSLYKGVRVDLWPGTKPKIFIRCRLKGSARKKTVASGSRSTGARRSRWVVPP